MKNFLIGIALAAVATRYDYLGITYCGQHTSQLGDTWIAVPVEQLGSIYQCGDLVYIRGQDWSLLARVEDAGPFGAYCVQMGEQCAPILFDVGGAVPFEGLSAVVENAYNVSEAARRVN